MQSAIRESAPSDILRRALVDRVGKNPAYSLRAFARDLGVSHAYLSMVLSGKRPVPVKRAFHFSQTVGLDQEEALAFLESCRRAQFEAKTAEPLVRPKPAAPKASGDEFFRVQLDQFRVLSEWYHLAILDLTLLDCFQPSERWIADKLGLTLEEVRGAVARLKRLGMLSVTRGKWTKRHRRLEVPTAQSHQAVRRFHQQMIAKALASLDSGNQEDFERRDITGTTMAVNPARLQEAKKRIQRFRRSLLKYLTRGECTELYQMNVQLFPLTSPEPKRRRP
jgi:uncharacterized protein (TIGR02147 family)